MAREDEVRRYVYDTTNPITDVFNVIYDYKDLYDLSGSVLQEDTMIKLAYAILNRSRIFKDSFMTWNDKSTIDKTWTNFESHFRKSYRDLRKVNTLSIQDSSINQAQLVQELKDHQAKSMLTITDALKSSFIDLFQGYPSPENDENANPNHQANMMGTSELTSLKNELK